MQALEGNQSVVTYEVILAMQSLVHKHGQELHEPAWDLIFNILLTIINQLGLLNIHTLYICYIEVLLFIQNNNLFYFVNLALLVSPMIFEHSVLNIFYSCDIFVILETTKSPYPLTVAHLHETITAIEVLHETNHFNGSVDNLFNVIDMCGNSRPVID